MHLFSTGGKFVFGVTLQFEECGCKHIDVCFGLVVLTVHFGTCKEGGAS